MRPMMCVFVAISAAGTVALGQVEDSQSTQGPARLTIDVQPITLRNGTGQADLSVASPTVRWLGDDFSLVQFGTVQLHLDENDHLTATLKGGVLTFDDVDCTIHLAVFDDKAMMLGTASVVEHVPRVWEGRMLLMFRTFELDFGTCACYRNVHGITGAATHGNVLTPDEWAPQNTEK